MTSEIKVDTISEQTSANGVAIDSLAIKDGKITNLMNATLSAADLGTGIHIKTADSGVSSAGVNGDELIIEGSGHAGLSIFSGTSSNGVIHFGDSGASADGYILYDHSNRKLDFGTASATQWSIDSSGNLLPAATDHGIYLGVSSATAANLLDDYEDCLLYTSPSPRD